MPTYLTTAPLGGPPRRHSVGVAVGELVFVDASALDLDTLQRLPDARTVADETRICLERVAQTLGEAGCTLNDLLKVNVYLSDDAYRTEFWTAYSEFLAPGPYPPGLTQIAGLDGDARVVLDVVAVRSDAGSA